MATTHDHSALIRNIQHRDWRHDRRSDGIARGVSDICCSASAIDTQWKHSIFHQALIAPDREGKMNQGEAKEAEQWFSETKQPVSITSRDGLKLHGWLFDPDCIDPTPHIYAICVHGYTGAPEEQAKWAHRYARMGFTVLAPSQRAQGSERRTICRHGLAWSAMICLNWIRPDRVDSDDRCPHSAVSADPMGAATVMMTTGDAANCHAMSSSAIAESGYTSARMEFIDSAARHSFASCQSFSPRHVWTRRDLICKRRAGYDFTEASCIPSLQAYGHSDAVHPWRNRTDMVSPRFLDMNYERLLQHRPRTSAGSGRTIIWKASAVDPKRYWDTVNAFIKRAFEL